MPDVVSLGDEARRRASPRRDPDRRELGEHMGPAARDQGGLEAEYRDARVVTQRDRHGRPTRPDRRPDGLPPRFALDDENLLAGSDRDAAANERGDRGE